MALPNIPGTANQSASITKKVITTSGVNPQSGGNNGPPGPPGPPGGGTVTSVAAGAGLTATPNPIVGAGTIADANTGVTAGTYGDSTHVAQITVNAKGRVTAASSIGLGSGNVPSGGAIYQRLAKNSATNYDTGWFGPYEFNVCDYGADPTGAADSYTAFNAAITDLNASTYGGTFRMPQGTYKIGTQPGIFNKPVRIIGGGMGATQVNFQGSINGFQIDFAGFGRYNATASDFSINTTSTASETALYYRQINNAALGGSFSFHTIEFGNGWNIGIDVQNSAENNIQGSSIYDIYMQGCVSGGTAAYGIRLYGSGNVSIWGCKIYEVGTGVYVAGSPLCEGVWISDSMVVNCKYGVDSDGANTWCRDVHVNISTDFGTGGVGIRLGGNECHVDHCYFLGNDSAATPITCPGNNALISNIRIINTTGIRWANGITVSGTACKVSGCLIENITGAAVDLTGSNRCDVDNIAFNDVLGATALVAGTNSFIRNCVGLGSNIDGSWTPGHY